MFALIQEGVVLQLFNSDPQFHPDLDVRDVSGVEGIQIGWVVQGDLIVPAAVDVDALKVSALIAIDACAGAARARYITVAPGQEATYILKAQQAAAFKAGGYVGTAPGLVQAEIDATGATAQQAADDILAQEAAWAYKAAQIESARRRGKVAAGNAADAAGVEAARSAAIAELGAL